MYKVRTYKVLLILFDPMEHDGGGSAICNGNQCMTYKVLRYKVLFTLFDPMEYDAQGVDDQFTADTV